VRDHSQFLVQLFIQSLSIETLQLELRLVAFVLSLCVMDDLFSFSWLTFLLFKIILICYLMAHLEFYHASFLPQKCQNQGFVFVCWTAILQAFAYQFSFILSISFCGFFDVIGLIQLLSHPL